MERTLGALRDVQDSRDYKFKDVFEPPPSIPDVVDYPILHIPTKLQAQGRSCFCDLLDMTKTGGYSKYETHGEQYGAREDTHTCHSEHMRSLIGTRGLYMIELLPIRKPLKMSVLRLHVGTIVFFIVVLLTSAPH